MIVNIGEGKRSFNGSGYELLSRDVDTQLFQLNQMEAFVENRDEESALMFLFPNGLSSKDCKGTTILAATNAVVDKWNQSVQALNPNDLCTLVAKDKFGDVDDPHNHIANAMTENVMN
jgi:hypothetical protein